MAKINLAATEMAVQNATRKTLLTVLETILRLTHPIMPFITEELWQTVAPLIEAKSTPSIMLANYPVADPNQIDMSAMQQVTLLKSLVNCVRNLRGEMQLGPAQKIPLYIENAASLAHHCAYIKALAKLSDVHVVPQLPDTNAPIAVLDQIRLLLEVKIDKTQERARLQKELAQLQQDIDKIAQKLDNAAFVAKAPVDIVTKEKTRFAQLTEMHQKIAQQLDKLI
jgi:valyl-tRNA synthetase